MTLILASACVLAVIAFLKFSDYKMEQIRKQGGQ